MISGSVRLFTEYCEIVLYNSACDILLRDTRATETGALFLKEVTRLAAEGVSHLFIKERAVSTFSGSVSASKLAGALISSFQSYLSCSINGAGLNKDMKKILQDRLTNALIVSMLDGVTGK